MAQQRQPRFIIRADGHGKWGVWDRKTKKFRGKLLASSIEALAALKARR